MTPTRPAGIPAHWEGAPFTWLWEYPDADGAATGYVARFDPPDGKKQCVPFFRRAENGSWASGHGEGPRPLFNLDGLAKAANTETVYVPEGEKCAAAVISLGLLATTSPGGCKAAALADWQPLARFHRVVILPDTDAPGEDYARDVCRALAALPGQREIKIARLPGLPEGGDVVDWLQARLAGGN